MVSTRSVAQGSDLLSGLGFLAGLPTKANLLGKLAATFGILRSHHRIILRQFPFFTVFLRRKVMRCSEMPLERLQLIPVLKTDDVVGLHRSTNWHGWFVRLNRLFLCMGQPVSVVERVVHTPDQPPDDPRRFRFGGKLDGSARASQSLAGVCAALSATKLPDLKSMPSFVTAVCVKGFPVVRFSRLPVTQKRHSGLHKASRSTTSLRKAVQSITNPHRSPNVGSVPTVDRV